MTVADYLPGATYVDLGPDGGPYDEMGHPKICWHTTEGTSIAGAEAAYRSYPPHIGYDPRSRVLRQYVRLDRHSYALRGGESDDEYVIQIELVGRAAETAGWPDEWYQNIGVDLVAPLRRLVGVPDQHLRFYGPNEGIVLASPYSPIRLSDAAFRAFSGHLGHQHVPAPDAHWDPGGFRIDKALNYSQENDMSWNERILTPSGKTYMARELLAWSNHYDNRIPAIEAMVGQLVAAVAEGELDPDAVLARVDTAVREATDRAMTTAILPALRAVLVEVLGEDFPEDQADAVVTELAERLKPAA